MEKSKHDSFNSFNSFKEIPVDELSNFINPINMYISINKYDMHYLFRDSNEVMGNIRNFYSDIFNMIPSMSVDKRDDFIRRYCTISYTPHTSGYDFRYNPIDFVNKLFNYLGTTYYIPFINLDNGYGISYLKDYTRQYIQEYNSINYNSVDYYLVKNILDDLNSNLDSIVNMYYVDINSDVNRNVIPKDMLLYLSCMSLYKYNKDKDDKYLVLPYEYYHNISHMKTSPYPHAVLVNGVKTWFPEFRDSYKSLVGEDRVIDDSLYLIDNNEVLLAWDILKPGMLERQVRDNIAFVRSNPNVDYDKYIKLFDVKMNYYMHSPYIKHIQGKYGLNGYIGFSYKNDYLLFDKFYNSETIDPSKRTILTHGEAIYGLPADRLSVIKGTKQDIVEAKKVDDRIRKVNHTPNYSFINKLDGIIYGPNLSLKSFDQVLEEEKKRMLIKQP